MDVRAATVHMPISEKDVLVLQDTLLWNLNNAYSPALRELLATDLLRGVYMSWLNRFDSTSVISLKSWTQTVHSVHPKSAGDVSIHPAISVEAVFTDLQVD